MRKCSTLCALTARVSPWRIARFEEKAVNQARFDNLDVVSDPQSALSFTAFVLSLASTAAIHFGDLPDPVTNEKAEPTLDGAVQMIEILSLLEQKTRGNLTAE